MSVKPTSGVTPPITSQTTSSSVSQGPKTQTSQAPAPNVVNPEAVAKALKDYQKLLKDRAKRPFLSGAANLFTDSVVFPAELLDPHNPANDSKYLHLLTAVLGLKDMEHFFASPEQLEEILEEDVQAKKEKVEKKGKPKKNQK